MSNGTNLPLNANSLLLCSRDPPIMLRSTNRNLMPTSLLLCSRDPPIMSNGTNLPLMPTLFSSRSHDPPTMSNSTNFPLMPTSILLLRSRDPRIDLDDAEKLLHDLGAPGMCMAVFRLDGPGSFSGMCKRDDYMFMVHGKTQSWKGLGREHKKGEIKMFQGMP